MKTELSKVMQHALLEKGISGNDLSRKMGTSASYVANALADNPTVDTLEAIAAAMGYDVQIAFVDRETGKRIEA